MKILIITLVLISISFNLCHAKGYHSSKGKHSNHGHVKKA